MACNRMCPTLLAEAKLLPRVARISRWRRNGGAKFTRCVIFPSSMDLLCHAEFSQRGCGKPTSWHPLSAGACLTQPFIQSRTLHLRVQLDCIKCADSVFQQHFISKHSCGAPPASLSLPPSLPPSLSLSLCLSLYLSLALSLSPPLSLSPSPKALARHSDFRGL